jgi:small-conductance mechanosensitive channel
MEENKKEEIQEETQESQPEAFLEPVPYKRKVEKEETEDTATVSEDTSSEEEATPKEERPVNAEEKVFKKRYDDLKRHYDSTVNKHKDDVEKLKRQLEENADKINLPKTKEEVDAWKAKYPDVYDIIETIAYTKADEKSKKLQSDLKELETQQASVQRDKAEVELAKLHPDFNDIREDEKFHEWVAKQDSTIQGWLYDNTSNAKLAARAIDLYKMDTGYGKKKTNKSLEASKSVTSTSKREVDTSNKKVWKISEIAKMKPQQFAKYEKDIDLARKEGRIVNG